MPGYASVLFTNIGAPTGSLPDVLASLGLEVRSSAPEAATAALDARVSDLVVVEADAVDDALALLERLRDRHPDVPVVLAVDGASVADAVRAMRAGAADFLTGPVESEQLRLAVDKTIEVSRVEPGAASTDAIVGESRPILKLRELIARAASGSSTVLVRGESGTGKELVARAVHDASPRAAQPFVKVHCGALPDALLESELFGYEKGAFTGATARKPGRVDLAQGGTLFLDEIGDITPALQVKLLRLLQDKQFERLGGGEPVVADIRFVAATHRDLEAMTKSKEFREDLFYRLDVVTLWLPPLRARRDDVTVLSKHFVSQLGAANGKPETRIAPDALDYLRRQRWPGNVRQLYNLIERLVVLGERPVIGLEDVRAEMAETVQFATEATGAGPLTLSRPRTATEVVPLSQEMKAAERAALSRALAHTKGNRALAARLLGVSRATLYNKLEQHGLS